MASDILEVVALEEIPELLKTFEKDWPKFYPLKQYITLVSEYKKAKIEEPNQTIYRYGDVETGVYLVETKFSVGGNINSIIFYFIYTASDDLSGLKHSLMRTSRIPWSCKGFVLEVIFDRFVPVIDEVARTKGVEFDIKRNYMMWLPEPVDFSTVPEEMYVARLDQSHVTEINNNWPHKFLGSEVYISQQLSNNFGLGLFRKTDKKLVCSALTFHPGGIFVLFTDPEFRGKGYADVIIRNMSCELHKRGRIPFATILLENIPSQKLFTKIGFQHFTKICFMVNVQKS